MEADVRKYEELIPRTAGFLISFMMTVVVMATTYRCGLNFWGNIQIVSLLVFALWGTLLIRAKGIKPYQPVQLLFISILTVLLGLYFTYWVWHRGYLTNTPLVSINMQENGLCYDTLFHVSIAQGIKNYGVPSFLVNSDSFFNYHFVSHLIMAAMSMISGIPVFFTYCYIYPILFLPLFVYLIFSVVQEFRYYKKNERTITVLDFFSVLCFIMPILLPRNICEILANWKTSWFVSESYLLAAVLTLLFFKFFFFANRNELFKSKMVKTIFEIIVIPFFIAISSLTKISFGFFLYIGIGYYFFRKHMKEIHYWMLEVYYAVCFSFVFLLPGRFYSPFISNTNFSSIDFLNHIKTYVSTDLWGFHMIAYYFFSIVVLAYQFGKEKNLVKIIKDKKYVLEEILLLICVLGAIPGNLFIIRGGSSFYFSSVQQLIAIILLLGFDIPNEVFEKLRTKLTYLTKVMSILIFLCICWDPLVNSASYAFTIIHDCKTGASLQYGASLETESYWSTICEIMNYVGHNEEEYYIYVDASANVWKRFTNKDIAMHFYPAMTGVVSIGELYYEDGQMYYNDGTIYTSGWYKTNPYETKLTLEEAINKTATDGKKALIYVYENSMKVISINQ